MYKEDSALNNIEWLICHKTQPTNQQTNLTVTFRTVWKINLNQVTVISTKMVEIITKVNE